MLRLLIKNATDKNWVKSTKFQGKLPKKLLINDGTELVPENKSYNTLKDPKPGLSHKETRRLINP